MAIRNIRVLGDPILNKNAKPVKEVSDKTKELIQDMLETMYQAEGVGLAAPQVGILKQIVVVDVTEEQNSPIILINPSIVKEEGEQKGSEGCLSVPGKVGIVTRPNFVKVKALNEDLEPIEMEGEGFLARAFVHELDHLKGELYVDKVEGELYETADFDEEEEE